MHQVGGNRSVGRAAGTEQRTIVVNTVMEAMGYRSGLLR
jgi:hypothetical protein